MSDSIALNGEEEGAELLLQLSSSIATCALPQEWAARVQLLQFWGEDSKLALSTLLRLCAALPSLRRLDVCNLTAPADDIPGLIATIRTANAFANVAVFELGLYRARDMPLTVVYAMMECMPHLRHLGLDVVHSPEHDAERPHIQRLDLSHIRLRSYVCHSWCVGSELPIKYSSATLEYLEIHLDELSPLDLAGSMSATLCSGDFSRLRTLRIIIDAWETTAEGLRALQLILKECRYVRRLLVRCVHSDLQALLNETTPPLYELAFCAAREIPKSPATVNAGLAAISSCLATVPALRSLRRLRVISDSDDSRFHAMDSASPALQDELKRTCAERRVDLVTFEDWVTTMMS